MGFIKRHNMLLMSGLIIGTLIGVTIIALVYAGGTETEGWYFAVGGLSGALVGLGLAAGRARTVDGSQMIMPSPPQLAIQVVPAAENKHVESRQAHDHNLGILSPSPHHLPGLIGVVSTSDSTYSENPAGPTPSPALDDESYNSIPPRYTHSPAYRHNITPSNLSPHSSDEHKLEPLDLVRTPPKAMRQLGLACEAASGHRAGLFAPRTQTAPINQNQAVDHIPGSIV